MSVCMEPSSQDALRSSPSLTPLMTEQTDIEAVRNVDVDPLSATPIPSDHDVNDNNVTGVSDWLQQLRGTWEQELSTNDEQLDEQTCVKQSQDDIKDENDMQNNTDTATIHGVDSDSSSILTTISSVSASATTSLSNLPSAVELVEARQGVDQKCVQEKPLIESLASQVLDQLPIPPTMGFFRDRIGRFFARSGSLAAEISCPADMRRYASLCRSVAQTHEKNILRLNTQRKKVEVAMRDELLKWEKWAMDALVAMARTFYETQRLHLNSLIEVEVRVVDFFRSMAEAAASCDSANILQRSSNQTLVPVESIVLPDVIVQMQESCKNMEIVIKDLHSHYVDAQTEAMRPDTKEKRTLKVTNLLRQAIEDATQSNIQSSEFHYHPPLKVSQVAFNRLLLDERQREGQLIKHWMTLLRDTLRISNRRVTSEAIIIFLDYLVKYLIKEYELEVSPIDFKPPLRLLVDRMIFPRIIRTTNRLRKQVEFDKDVIFRRKTRWLWRVSQEQLGIIEIFRSPIEYDLAAPPPGMMRSPVMSARSPSPDTHLPDFDLESSYCPLPDDFPFIEPIRLLSKLECECVPTNMLFTIVATISAVQRSCRLYAKNDTAVVDADSLFPAIVWTVVHTNASNIHNRIGHLSRFVSDQLRNFGEPGFCLSLIEATLAYIEQLKPSRFGLHDNLDDDKLTIAALARTSVKTESPLTEQAPAVESSANPFDDTTSAIESTYNELEEHSSLVNDDNIDRDKDDSKNQDSTVDVLALSQDTSPLDLGCTQHSEENVTNFQLP